MNHHHYRTKYGLDTAVAIIFIMLGACTISMVFGMLLFAVFTHVCADTLLLAVAKVGYAGSVLLAAGLLLETYNLYEHHRKHIAVLVAVTAVVSVVTILMIHFVAQAYSCQL